MRSLKKYAAMTPTGANIVPAYNKKEALKKMNQWLKPQKGEKFNIKDIHKYN